MHSLHSIMCFSSCIICLLIVAGHGSPIPGHDGVINEHGPDLTSRENVTHHLHYLKPSGLKRLSNASHHHKISIKERSQAEQNGSAVNTFSRNPRDTERKEVSKESSLPVPSHMESQHLFNSSQNPHSDHHIKNITFPSQSESLEQPEHHYHHDDHHYYEKLNDHHISEKHSESDDHERNSVEVDSDVHQVLPNSHTSHPCDNHEGSHLHENNHSHDSKAAPLADHHQHFPVNTRDISGYVWLYSSIAVLVISLCGLLSVAIIPIMQKWFYHTLLQFLVGLAVGSLSGDGLLHLMPHAILDGVGTHDHDGNHSDLFDSPSGRDMEKTAIWRGLAALGGIFLFFIAERLLGALTVYKRQKMEAKFSRHSKKILPVVQLEEDANNGNVGEKIAQPKKNSYDHIKENDEKETIQMLETDSSSPLRKLSIQSTHDVGFHGRSSFSLDPDLSVACRPDSESSVIVSEHHGHNHAHTHDIPHSVSAVAWMVIMGDGLHNFCDGLAIGAAFASGDADGISTTVAVFCHELPHELGDFAMLLKTGMKVRQALFYNALSSILCFIGMIIGVLLGNVTSATRWVFSGTAGMFLYIALVDMLPELSNGNESGLSSIITLVVQVVGIFMGISVMLLIALYEHQLHTIVS